MSDYTIEARSLSLGGVASHDFWVLKDANGKVLAELHGLATDRTTNEVIPIGYTSDHSLRVYELPRDSAYALSKGVSVSGFYYAQAGQQAETVFSGSSTDVLARWDAAVNAIPVLNNLDLDYPPLGFNVFSPTVNSNSAYRTFGEIMGVPLIDFPNVVEPGFDNRMVPLETIDSLKYKGTGQTSSWNDDFWDAIFGFVDNPANSQNNSFQLNVSTLNSASGNGTPDPTSSALQNRHNSDEYRSILAIGDGQNSRFSVQ